MNAGVLAKKKHLEEFIAKNKARASTATRANPRRSSSKNSRRFEIAAEEPRVSIRPPQVEPRRGSALRCLDLAIGYPERQIASGIGVEVGHAERTAIVGDNGQGKTTFLRTIVDSLQPLAGEVRWGHGCSIGIYAQHVYTSLPPKQTVYEYLENTAAGRHQDAGDSERRRLAAVPRRGRQEEDFGPFRRRTGPALPGGADAQPAQHPGPRRAG